MKKLKVGIIGCGGIANQKHMPALKALSEDCEMVAFCDIIESRAVKAAEQFGVPGPGCTPITGTCCRRRKSMWYMCSHPT